MSSFDLVLEESLDSAYCDFGLTLVTAWILYSIILFDSIISNFDLHEDLMSECFHDELHELHA